MIQLPIEPNLKTLQQLFIFEYTKYQKIDYNDFELKLFNKNFLHVHEVINIFEASDSLNFYARNLGTEKEPLFTRYIFYKTHNNEYFVARLNDVKSIYNFVGVTENFNRIFSSGDLTTRIYKTWKMPLKKYATKRGKKNQSISIDIFN